MQDANVQITPDGFEFIDLTELGNFEDSNVPSRDIQVKPFLALNLQICDNFQELDKLHCC